MNDHAILARRIKVIIESARINVSSELAAHDAIEALLVHTGLTVDREVRLSPNSRVDLMCAGIAIEVKSARAGQRRKINDQINRYTQLNAVNGLVLASSRSFPVPGEMNCKPVFFASLNMGWLG